MTMSLEDFLMSEDGNQFLIIDPEWSDEIVRQSWRDNLSVCVDDDARVTRHVWHRFSDDQCDLNGVERGSWWGDDGELDEKLHLAEVEYS